ncbi:cysteine methyltransferase [Zhengella mangrovi]|uniref:Methylated-DNA--protein-cysteine methyltransferase n=1 Tax=Zhengella mangrovi TaxID=1982044 RepID=A0A2G1QUM0_9HYPH|nr:methylated-DNA--[protein]-cysteine S-methyltransferase [Zhengella mangrovi]PHP69159.1 cysteine methyltransferase [Zhengella mangrovi]
MENTALLYTWHESPVGPLLMAGRGDVLHVLSFPAGNGKRSPRAEWQRDDAILPEHRRQIDAYFAGRLTAFDLPLQPVGSPFQLAVWRELTRIPYGETASYGDIARRLGEPVSASRAVGAANGDNPLPIVVPCHRVIGADGSLTGFGGGLAIKRYLLDLEDRVAQKPGRQLGLFG